MDTAAIGVERGEAMHEPALKQEIERAVDGRRCRRAAVLLQLVEQCVCADRAVAGPYQLQHAPAQGREPVAAARAQLGGGGDGIVDAAPMIVPGAGKGACSAAAAGLSHPCLLATLSYNIV